MSQYIEDLKKLNIQHNYDNCFIDNESFFETVVKGSSNWHPDSLKLEKPPYDLEKAAFIQGMILILQLELGINDYDIYDILNDIAKSPVI